MTKKALIQQKMKLQKKSQATRLVRKKANLLTRNQVMKNQTKNQAASLQTRMRTPTTTQTMIQTMIQTTTQTTIQTTMMMKRTCLSMKVKCQMVESPLNLKTHQMVPTFMMMSCLLPPFIGDQSIMSLEVQQLELQLPKHSEIKQVQITLPQLSHQQLLLSVINLLKKQQKRLPKRKQLRRKKKRQSPMKTPMKNSPSPTTKKTMVLRKLS